MLTCKHIVSQTAVDPQLPSSPSFTNLGMISLKYMPHTLSFILIKSAMGCSTCYIAKTEEVKPRSETKTHINKMEIRALKCLRENNKMIFPIYLTSYLRVLQRWQDWGGQFIWKERMLIWTLVSAQLTCNQIVQNCNDINFHSLFPFTPPSKSLFFTSVNR